jgi:hypothetical protein
LLDDLFVASAGDGQGAAKPSIPFDYLAVVDELHSGRIKVSGEALAEHYREAGTDLAAEFAALLADVDLADPGMAREAALPPVDPASIAAELGLDRPGADLRRLRRDFAFANHPDRVAPHLRQRAAVRMQVANMLIDEARRKALPATRRR